MGCRTSPAPLPRGERESAKGTRARQRQRAPASHPPAVDRIIEQRRLIDDMQHQLRHLATENAGLLRRVIEAQQRADRAERRSAQLTKEIGSLQRPTMLA